MRPVLKITRQFDTLHMEREMNRLVNGLYDFAGQVAGVCDVQPTVDAPVRTGTTAASYDTMLRVSPATDSTTVTVQLPQPVTTDGGKICRIVRTTTGGNIIIQTVGSALLNGVTRLFMFDDPGMIEVRFDGANFWTTSYGALSWSEAF